MSSWLIRPQFPGISKFCCPGRFDRVPSLRLSERLYAAQDWRKSTNKSGFCPLTWRIRLLSEEDIIPVGSRLTETESGLLTTFPELSHKIPTDQPAPKLCSGADDGLWHQLRLLQPDLQWRRVKRVLYARNRRLQSAVGTGPARLIASAIRLRATSASIQSPILTHFPGSRSL